MQIFEYVLHLGTGENLSVLEIDMAALDAWSRQAFDDPCAKKALSSIFSLCTRVSKEAIEDAKIGWTKPLEKLLRTPPIGALLKLDKPICFNLRDCAMADPNKCTTRPACKNISLPECWDYDIGTAKDFPNSMIAAQEVAKTIVVTGWSNGKYVIISE